MTQEIIRPKDLQAVTGLCHMTIWRLEKKNLFPKRRQLSTNAVGWTRAEIEEWLQNRPKKAA